jgi:hypothetical protein
MLITNDSPGIVTDVACKHPSICGFLILILNYVSFHTLYEPYYRRSAMSLVFRWYQKHGSHQPGLRG